MDSEPNTIRERTSEKKGWKARQNQSIKTHYKRHGLHSDDPEGQADYFAPGSATSPRSPGLSRIAGTIYPLRYSSSTPDEELESPERSPSSKSWKTSSGLLSPRKYESNLPGSHRNQSIDRSSKIPMSPLNKSKEHKSFRFKVVEATQKETSASDALKEQMALLSDRLAAQKLQSQQSINATVGLEEEIFRLNSLRLREEHQIRSLEARLRESDKQVELLTASNRDLRGALLRSQMEVVKMRMAGGEDTDATSTTTDLENVEHDSNGMASKS